MGPLAFVLIGAGAVLVWSGVQGVNALDVVKSVLSGESVPRGEKAKAAAAERATKTKTGKAAATDTDDATTAEQKKAARKAEAQAQAGQTDAMTEAMRS